MSFVVAVRSKPVWVSTTLILVFGMTPPEASLTVPVISPEEPTPCACTTPAANSKQTNVHASDFIGFSLRKYLHIAALVRRIPHR